MPFRRFAFVVSSVFVALPATAQTWNDTVGFSIDDDWGQAWRRILHRHGRLDANGPIQQRFNFPNYPEYTLDQMVGDYPLSMERAWTNDWSASRTWFHSINAETLAHHAQLKLAMAPRAGFQFRVRYDRLELRERDDNVLRMDFRWQHRPHDGLFAGLSIYPRLEKPDIDFQVFVGYRDSRWGRAQLKVFFLDALTNGSYAVGKGRMTPPDILPKQTDIPLALALEYAGVEIKGFRGEAYAGVVLPQKRRIYHTELDQSHVVREAALLLGGMLEWRAKDRPLSIGASGLAILNDWERRDRDLPEEGRRLEERTVQARIYAFTIPSDRLRIESQVLYSARPEKERWDVDPSRNRDRKDHELVASIRAPWMLSENFGIELGYWFRTRGASGGPEVFVDGTHHRVVTRALFKVAGFRATVGVGWDPDRRRTVYGGGGGSILVDF